MWEGIYDFPWRVANLKALLPLWFAFSFLALLAAGYHALFSFIADQAAKSDLGQTSFFMIAVRVGAYIFAGLTFLSILSAVYPAACFLNVIEDTAGGNEDVKWESISVTECVGKLLYLVWVFGCSAAPPGAILEAVALVSPISRALWWMLVFTFALVLFPVCLLSTLAGASPWVLLEPRLLVALIRKPHVILVIYANAIFFGFPCLLYGYWTIYDYHLWLVPLVGLVWATYFLTYARVLGRAGWALSEIEQDRPFRKRRRQTKEDADE